MDKIIHQIPVKAKYFNLLKIGEKIIELRLWDHHQSKIKVGDEIIFCDSLNRADHFKASVVALHRAQTFEKLCDTIDPRHAGFAEKRELVMTMLQFYSLGRQTQLGVVGIQVKKVSA